MFTWVGVSRVMTGKAAPLAAELLIFAGGGAAAVGGVGPSVGGVGPSVGGTGPSVGGVGPSVGGTGPSVGGTGRAARRFHSLLYIQVSERSAT